LAAAKVRMDGARMIEEGTIVTAMTRMVLKTLVSV